MAVRRSARSRHQERACRGRAFPEQTVRLEFALDQHLGALHVHFGALEPHQQNCTAVPLECRRKRRVILRLALDGEQDIDRDHREPVLTELIEQAGINRPGQRAGSPQLAKFIANAFRQAGDQPAVLFTGILGNLAQPRRRSSVDCDHDRTLRRGDRTPQPIKEPKAVAVLHAVGDGRQGKNPGEDRHHHAVHH